MKDMVSSLPVEMIHAVADETDRHGILALRSTSRTMRAGCNDAFLRNFFTHRRHILSTHSLFALLSIASNPALRPQLKSVDLILVHLHEEDVPPEDQNFRKSRRPKRTHAELREVARQNAVWSEWLQLRETFLKIDITLLSDSFRHLARAGISLDLSLTANWNAEFAHEPYGFNHLSRSLGSALARTDTSASGEMFWKKDKAPTRLFSSFAGSELKVRTLSISDYGTTTSFSSFNMNGILLAGLGMSLSSLKSIDLKLHNTSISGVDNLITTMQCATGIEHIKLECRFFLNHRNHHEPFSNDSWITPAFSKARLKSITLCRSRIERQKLHELLHQHKDSLESLTLVSITLTDGDDWAPLLAWIPETLSLGNIHVNDLRQFSDNEVQHSDHGFQVHGVEEIKETMDGFVEGMEFANSSF